ncbi:MAG: hypothetical protein IKA55_00135 [Akkermansia sp.]|nr:hypothetical protein [Akkermansia sp.]
MKKRTLLIGLGGVGGQVLLAWRRALAAGGMPPVGDELACMYLDAADDVVSTPEWQELAADIPFLNIKTEARSLNEIEQNPELKGCVAGMRWQVADALKVPVYEVEQALAGLPGAGGWRRYGRALLQQSWAAVLRMLTPLVEGVEQLEVHVFFSAAGGTGCGAAMDMLAHLEKLCLRKPGSVLLPYAFFTGEMPQEQRLAAELADWLDLADEELVPHCYVSSPVAPLPDQVQTFASALACGRQFFYIGGEYYDHLYDAIRPRGSAPGDRFASLGFAAGLADDCAWLGGIRSLTTVEGEGRGPRYTLLVAFPRGTEDTRRLELTVEDVLEDALPFHLNETAFCCMAPGPETCALLLQSGIAPSRLAVFNRLAALEGSTSYFDARDDRG